MNEMEKRIWWLQLGVNKFYTLLQSGDGDAARHSDRWRQPTQRDSEKILVSCWISELIFLPAVSNVVKQMRLVGQILNLVGEPHLAGKLNSFRLQVRFFITGCHEWTPGFGETARPLRPRFGESFFFSDKSRTEPRKGNKNVSVTRGDCRIARNGL